MKETPTPKKELSVGFFCDREQVELDVEIRGICLGILMGISWNDDWLSFAN